jgi:hypothetical protein
MSRLCEICGAPIGVSPGVCQSCGFSYGLLNVEEPIMVGQPRWGIIQLDFPTFESAANISIVSDLRSEWQALEKSGFQKLAPSQLHLIKSEACSLRLVGPYSSFKKIQEHFDNQLKILFLDRSPSEIDILLEVLKKCD